MIFEFTKLFRTDWTFELFSTWIGFWKRRHNQFLTTGSVRRSNPCKVMLNSCHVQLSLVIIYLIHALSSLYGIHNNCCLMLHIKCSTSNVWEIKIHCRLIRASYKSTIKSTQLNMFDNTETKKLHLSHRFT